MIAVALMALLAAQTPEQFFDRKVAPILTKRCLPCHNKDLDNAGVSFQNPATLKRVIVSGQPDQSRLIKTLRHEGGVRMPPGLPLPKREIKVLREWVKQGAVFGAPLR